MQRAKIAKGKIIKREKKVKKSANQVAQEEADELEERHQALIEEESRKERERLLEVKRLEDEERRNKGYLDTPDVKNDLEAMLDDGPVVNASKLLSRTSSGYAGAFKDEAHLTAGCSFGELAIMHDRPRNATIKCITRCHFLTLCRKDYIETLNEIIKRQ